MTDKFWVIIKGDSGQELCHIVYVVSIVYSQEQFRKIYNVSYGPYHMAKTMAEMVAKIFISVRIRETSISH